METAFSSFLQVYQEIPDQVYNKFTYKDKSKNDFYTMLKSNSIISVVAGAK